VRGLCEFLCAHLDDGGGLDILPRIEENRFRPSKKLMDQTVDSVQSRTGGESRGRPDLALTGGKPSTP
jgi:hypothetical protein